MQYAMFGCGMLFLIVTTRSVSAQEELLPLPEAHKYSMVVISAYIPSGLTSRVHLHSGVEAFYVVDGE